MTTKNTTQTVNAMNKLIKETTDLIARYSPGLAKVWEAEPFNRCSIAYAFASGFAKSDSDDINSDAITVIRVALLDREIRRGAA